MAKKKAAKKSSAIKVPAGKKNSLVANINRRKKAGKSRKKDDSTISSDAYEQMEQGWPKGKKAVKKKK